MPKKGEIGRIGAYRYGGIIYEEFLTELQGRRGAEIYKEMADNDDMVGAILFVVEMLMRQCSFSVEPGGDTAKDKEAAEFVESCMHDMQHSWQDFISEAVSFLTYGWSYHEIVYKRRMGKTKDPKTSSKYDDGLIGWRKLPLRAQESLWEWKYEEDEKSDELIGMVQMPSPTYELFTIPLEKALHFRTKSRKDNPEGRSVLRNAYRCFDEETEILTSAGWKKGTDITVNDMLATLNPETLCIEYQNPTEINHYHHEGELIHFHSRFVDIRVTDNHRMWVRKDKQKSYKIVDASAVNKRDKFMAHGNWVGEEQAVFKLPEYEVWQKFRNGERKLKEVQPEIEISMDDWIAFLGLYLAEGCTYLTNRGQAIVSITQNEGNDADAIRKLMDRLPFDVYEHRNHQKINFEIFDRRLYQELKPLGKAWEKFVPEYVKVLSPRQIQLFIDWYWFGDGTTVGGAEYKETRYKGTKQIFTTSEKMADDLQELALLSGYVGRKRVKEKQESHWGDRPLYIVTIGKPMEFSANNIDHEEYNGIVWCPTTENGIVYVRRNGKPAWVGNCWYFKKRIQEIEGIGMERDLAGFPVLTGPEELDLWDTEDPDMVAMLAAAQNIVTNIRRDAKEGLVLNNGWKLELLSAGNRRQFDTNQIIERYDKRIATTVIADFIMLGQQQTGSYALSSDKTRLFSLAIGTYLDVICEVFNSQGIPRLIDINGDHFKGITEYPKMVHGDIEDANLEKLGTYISSMVTAGVLIPDEPLEDFVRRAGNLPERDEGVSYSPEERMEMINPKKVAENQEAEKNANVKGLPQKPQGKKVKPEDGEDDDEDEEQAQKARKSLGRS